jgi:hypothetical protein
MKSFEFRRTVCKTVYVGVATLCLAVAVGCSSSPATPAMDAGEETVMDVQMQSDAPVADVASEPIECPDFSGAWTLTGTCSVPGFSPFPSACITQTGCTAQIAVAPGVLPGMIAGGRLTFSTSVSGVPLMCVATLPAGGGINVQCDAAGGAATCTAMGTRITYPGSMASCCNVTPQACGMGQRCTIVSEGPMNASLVTACIPSGTLAEGATCTRMEGRVGADNCGTGLFCANIGQAMATSRTCQTLCRSTEDCGTGRVCAIVSDSPRAGVCTPTCTVGGTDCAMGTCRYQTTYASNDASAPTVIATYCSPTGAAAEGSTCTNNNDCAANLVCTRLSPDAPLLCRRTCDNLRGCSPGQMCRALTGSTNPMGGGYCIL